MIDNQVVSQLTKEKNGYDALQIGAINHNKEKNVSSNNNSRAIQEGGALPSLPMHVKLCWFGGLGTMSASDSADSSQSSDTEDSSSTDTSSESSIPAPYSFEPSESDSEAKMTYPPAWKTGLFPSSLFHVDTSKMTYPPAWKT